GGARLYSVQIETRAVPILQEVMPNPDLVLAGAAYTRQMVLLQADPLPTWSVLQGPPALSISSSGLVTGWTPQPADGGKLFTLTVQATNSSGSTVQTWQVQVVAVPGATVAEFPFDADAEGWTLETWHNGPSSGSAAWR